MPIVHHVKSARKAQRKYGIKVGDSYYWWRTRRTVGKTYQTIKHVSKTRPRPSQLTSSPFLQEVYSLLEDIEDTYETNDLEGYRDGWKDTAQGILDGEQEKLDNLPQSLQDGSSGQEIQSRIDALQSFIEALEAIDIPEYEDDGEGTLGDALEEFKALEIDL